MFGLIFAFTLNWNTIYGISVEQISKNQLSVCMAVILCSVGIQFFMRPILAVMESLKMSAVANSLAVCSNLCLLVFAIALGSTKIAGNYIVFSFIYLACINVPLLMATIIIFKSQLKDCRPNILSKFDFKMVKSLMVLNVVFFIIQISHLMIYGVNSLLIANMYGPSYVTDYTKYYKLFSTIDNTFTGVFQAPLWVAVARAKEIGDIQKIKKLRKTSMITGFAFSMLSVLVFCMLPFIFQIWLGDQAPEFSWLIALVFLVDCIIKITACSFTIIGNGLSAIKSQAIVFVIAAVVKIPLSIMLKSIMPVSLSFTPIILSTTSIVWLVVILMPFEISKVLLKMKAQKKMDESNEYE